MVERYYLQKINQHQFIVREVQGKEPSKEDRIVRTFEHPGKAAVTLMLSTSYSVTLMKSMDTGHVELCKNVFVYVLEHYEQGTPLWHTQVRSLDC